jgi:hypothetical protein
LVGHKNAGSALSPGEPGMVFEPLPPSGDPDPVESNSSIV